MNNSLKRYPIRKNDLLQAWDSADELILEEALEGERILIMNDAFGALTSALRERNPMSYTDSFVSAKATELNSGRMCLSDLAELDGPYDLALLKIPKNMSFFEDELCHLTKHLKPGARVICGAMVKHLPKTAFELLEKYMGPVTTSLAKKKARLIYANFSKIEVPSPYPVEVTLDGFKQPFLHHSNLFSREKLDIGTRFFLEHIPSGPFETILDLGCANGIVGIKAKLQNPKSRIIFSDESAMAVRSALFNFERHTGEGATAHWSNCYEDQPANSLDLVLCNPPFHQAHAVGDFIAWQMFTDAHRSLKKGGLLRIIGNSHLGYQHKLKKVFGNSAIVATNAKFTIIDARK